MSQNDAINTAPEDVAEFLEGVRETVAERIDGDADGGCCYIEDTQIEAVIAHVKTLEAEVKRLKAVNANLMEGQSSSIREITFLTTATYHTAVSQS